MHVEKTDLQALLALLDESKKLHEGGWFEAHEVAAKARELLQKIIAEGEANGSKFTG